MKRNASKNKKKRGKSRKMEKGSTIQVFFIFFENKSENRKIKKIKKSRIVKNEKRRKTRNLATQRSHSALQASYLCLGFPVSDETLNNSLLPKGGGRLPSRPKWLQKCVVRILLFFELIKTLKFRNGDKSFRGTFFLKLQISFGSFFFFFKPSPPHNSQRIDANTDATNNTTKTTHSNTYWHILTHGEHNTHFQHRYRPTSLQVA